MIGVLMNFLFLEVPIQKFSRIPLCFSSMSANRSNTPYSDRGYNALNAFSDC